MRPGVSRHIAADQALSRAAGAPLVDGNDVRVLRDGAENYPAWLAAIEVAESFIHFDSYIVHDDRTGQLAGTLSGGEQQMRAIGRGLMAEPKLLILDEPSLGLSPLLVEEMFALIGQLNREGLAVLLVEQNVGQSLEIAQRAYVLENGAILFSGTGADLLASDALRLAYLGV